MSGHTPGPWAWYGDGAHHQIYLATAHSGRRWVMGFNRWGMRGAQPCFQSGGILRAASDLFTFVVGDKSVRGIAAAKSDGSVYRYDVSGIDHPDARLIAAAPDLLAACKAYLDMAHDLSDVDAVNAQIEAAIAKAEGQQTEPGEK